LKEEGKIIVLDACVIIDYVKCEPNLLQSINHHIAVITIVSPLLQEILDIDRDPLRTLDCSIIDPTFDEIDGAISLADGNSFQDYLCYLVAKRLDCPCITNDKGLRNYCSAHDVQVFWGLELLLILMFKGIISRNNAFHYAEQIQKINPTITQTILSAFTKVMQEQEKRKYYQNLI